MLQLPRLAVGAAHSDIDYQPISWAIAALMSARGHQVQHFHSTATFPCVDGAASSTGTSSRFLDSWLMTPEICREIFAHGAARATLAIVDGKYAPAGVPSSTGSLGDLCEWLDLPRLVVLDCTQLGDCQLPPRPVQADGLLLDKITDARHLARLQTTLESIWRIPVVGALEPLPQLRGQFAALPRGTTPDVTLCQRLGAALGRYSSVQRLMSLADRRPFHSVDPFLFRERPRPAFERKLTIAVAYDEAFRCYYPDALEMLELAGASIVDFSPLRDEALPAEADLVYLGCGHPERYAEALAANHCMLFALREHLCAGRRVYAEGGGLAYLCEHLATPHGKRVPMVGVVPGTARANPRPTAPTRTTVTLAKRCWLGPVGTTIRGYLNSNWLFESADRCQPLAAETGKEQFLIGRYQAVGSRLHVNLVAQPDILRGFLRPAHEPQAV